MALWFFLTVALGVIRDAAVILRVPTFVAAGTGFGGLCAAAALGYLAALFVEEVDPSPNYVIFVTAIMAMAIGFVGSNIVVTRRSLASAFRKAVAASGEADDADAAMREKTAAAARAYGLTNRELDVLAILARGHGLARVQENLFISEGTAITHRRHIYQKLDVHSKSELIDRVASFGARDYEEG
jgi:DNA-binding CsgD family transcriptional regulator